MDAINLNEKRKNNPGPDLLATRADGRQVTVSVKSRDGGTDYEIGKSFAKHPSDIYAFVDDGRRARFDLPRGSQDDREARLGTQQPVPRREELV